MYLQVFILVTIVILSGVVPAYHTVLSLSRLVNYCTEVGLSRHKHRVEMELIYTLKFPYDKSERLGVRKDAVAQLLCAEYPYIILNLLYYKRFRYFLGESVN